MALARRARQRPSAVLGLRRRRLADRGARRWCERAVLASFVAVAHRSWTDAIASLREASHFADLVGCTLALADIRMAQGRLREALSSYELGLSNASGQVAQVSRGAADIHAGMSELFLERNDLDTARQHLDTSRERGK